MLLISAFPGMTLLEETVLNSAMLVMLVSPVLYYFLLRPLIHQINKRHSAEGNLRKAHDEMERRVLARTYELAESNKQLTGEMAKRLKVVGELQESEEKYRTLVNSTDDSIYLVDRDCKYLFMNKKHITRLGLSEDDYLGKHYSAFHSQEISSLFFEKVNKIFDAGSPMQFEYKSETDDRYFLQTLSPVKSPSGKTFAISVISKNITDRKIMEEELRTLSLTDELTGLYNRRGFHALAEQQLRMANRLKNGIFMLYADIDNLKEINDTYGHQEGDRILVEFAKILKENYRESDIIARIGGDEYIVIPVGSAEDNIEVINSRFYACLERYNKHSNLKHDITASIGIVFYDPASPCTIDSLLVQADKLMYCQKNEIKR
jgi:diguanylate cyclase (GGDEF)-like protein/PAS domain S-box-containing protein